MDTNDIKYVDIEGKDMDFDETTWHAIRAYFRDTPGALVSHQLDSYNDAVSQVNRGKLR